MKFYSSTCCVLAMLVLAFPRLSQCAGINYSNPPFACVMPKTCGQSCDGYGEICKEGFTCEFGVCYEPRNGEIGSQCGTSDPCNCCKPELVCVANSSGGGTTGTCQSLPASGAPCSTSIRCRSGFKCEACTSKCVPADSLPMYDVSLGDGCHPVYWNKCTACSSCKLENSSGRYRCLQ